MAEIKLLGGEYENVFYDKLKEQLIKLFEEMEPTKPETMYKTARIFARFIDGVLLEYDDPEALEITMEPTSSSSLKVTIVTQYGFFCFNAFKRYNDVTYRFNSSYVSQFQVEEYYWRIHPGSKPKSYQS